MKPKYRIAVLLLISLAILFGGCASQKAQWPDDTLQAPQKAAGPMESPEYLYGSGQLLLEAGDIDQAEAFFDKALAADDTYIAAMTGMADVALARGDTDKAVYWAKRAVKKSATDADRRDAITALMKVYGSTRPDGWLNKMESLWEDVREVEEKPEAAAPGHGQWFSGGRPLPQSSGLLPPGHQLAGGSCGRCRPSPGDALPPAAGRAGKPRWAFRGPPGNRKPGRSVCPDHRRAEAPGIPGQADPQKIQCRVCHPPAVCRSGRNGTAAYGCGGQHV
jgi:tetratricopeptide (TPR) repeat protein